MKNNIYIITLNNIIYISSSQRISNIYPKNNALKFVFGFFKRI